MKTVGLICEGVSELNVLETILTRFLGESYVINPIQPETRVENGVRFQEGGGGWSRVISLCNSVKRKEILEHNDYLVIQLDSDACEHYGVDSLDANHKKKSSEVLLKDIIQNLESKIFDDGNDEDHSRIVFAICIDETECWLLPLVYSDKHRCADHNCLFLLNDALRKKNMTTVSEDDKNSPNSRKAYRAILRMIRKKADVEMISKENAGFKQFVQDLKSLTID